MAKKITLPDEFNKKIDNAINEMLFAFAERMAEDCRKQYQKTIDEFYADYKPHSYDRTLETKYAHNLYGKNYKSITTIVNSTTVQIRFLADSSFISGTPYRADTKWVFDRTFEEGIHGWTPDEVLEYSSGGNYGYFDKKNQFHINKMLNHMPAPPLSPSPKERMNEWYRQYKKPTNLRQIMQPISKQILDKYL